MTAVAPVPCQRCGSTSYAGRLDSRRWCAECRACVLPLAQRWAWLGVALAAAAWIGGTVAIGVGVQRWIVLWSALGGLFCFAAFKIVRRVAFEVLQARGLPLPSERVVAEEAHLRWLQIVVGLLGGIALGWGLGGLASGFAVRPVGWTAIGVVLLWWALAARRKRTPGAPENEGDGSHIIE